MKGDYPVGKVQEIILQTTDGTETTLTETNITGNNFKVNNTATYTEVNAAMKKIVALSNNTYSDTILTTSISVNDKTTPEPVTITPREINATLMPAERYGEIVDYTTTQNVTTAEGYIIKSAIAKDTSPNVTIYGPRIKLTNSDKTIELHWRTTYNGELPSSNRKTKGILYIIINDDEYSILYNITYLSKYDP